MRKYCGCKYRCDHPIFGDNDLDGVLYMMDVDDWTVSESIIKITEAIKILAINIKELKESVE